MSIFLKIDESDSGLFILIIHVITTHCNNRVFLLQSFREL